jgi:hypothetical protein
MPTLDTRPRARPARPPAPVPLSLRGPGRRAPRFAARPRAMAPAPAPDGAAGHAPPRPAVRPADATPFSPGRAPPWRRAAPSHAESQDPPPSASSLNSFSLSSPPFLALTDLALPRRDPVTPPAPAPAPALRAAPPRATPCTAARRAEMRPQPPPRPAWERPAPTFGANGGRAAPARAPAAAPHTSAARRGRQAGGARPRAAGPCRPRPRPPFFAPRALRAAGRPAAQGATTLNHMARLSDAACVYRSQCPEPPLNPPPPRQPAPTLDWRPSPTLTLPRSLRPAPAGARAARAPAAAAPRAGRGPHLRGPRAVRARRPLGALYLSV